MLRVNVASYQLLTKKEPKRGQGQAGLISLPSQETDTKMQGPTRAGEEVILSWQGGGGIFLIRLRDGFEVLTTASERFRGFNG
jgi:hypothetical protein